MMTNFLYDRLDRVIRREQGLKLCWKLAACWGVAVVLGLLVILVQRQTGLASRWAYLGVAVLAVAASAVAIVRNRRSKSDYRTLALKIEQRHPELNGVLITAIQQEWPEGKDPSYLQYRVMQTAMTSSQDSDWRDLIPNSRFAWAGAAQVAALVLLVATLAFVRTTGAKGGTLRLPFGGLVVTPGNTTIEKGESLVVLARFGGALPAGVEMVVSEASQPTRKVPLVKSLADPVFGGSVAEVKDDLVYHLEYGGSRTPDYKVKVFEHPRLERADAQLTYPTYTNLPVKRIEDTHRVSAVEGTHLDLALQLNKPVKTAKLVARNKEKTVIPLQVVAGKATASLPDMLLTATQSYDLQLVDADGRTNKSSTPFVIEVLPNRPPEIKLTSPRGDQRPSAIEEITFDGTIWDDFGAPAYGLAYNVAGGETKSIELGKAVPGKEKRPFSYVLSLESLGVQPDQLISWYVWADDIGPDGKVRRTNGDMYFGEVRPFDEVFKESQDMMSQEQEQQQGQQGQGNQARKLTELQKQIMSATWKLQRDPKAPKYTDDVGTVRDSQKDAITQASSSKEDATNPKSQALWSTAITKMEEAVPHLNDAVKSPVALADALKSEQEAYQALLRLQTRETQVSRSRRGQGGQGGQGGNQRQLDQLELTQSDNRYETQKQASAPQSQERKEQSQVMNRLQELSHRQQDLNDRMKEMQTALQEARTEQQKDEVRRQLKRLQEEQRQMLADADELKQRMDRPENQSRMNEQRQQLEQARNDLQRAAEAAGDGSVAQAVAAGTRAQRQLQEMREELRKQNSSEFSEDLRNMRAEARDLASDEEDVGRKLAALGDTQHKSLSSSDNSKEVTDQLKKQEDRMKALMDKASEISQQAETSEPLLAKQLYDSVRKVSQDDSKAVKEMQRDLLDQGITRDLENRSNADGKDEAGQALALTSSMVQQGYLPQAAQAEQKARAGINDLRQGVERAAESVLGDDTEALRLAKAELDAVTDQLQKEMAQGDGKTPGRGAPGDPSANPANNNGAAGGQPGADDQRLANNDGSAGNPSASGQPSGENQPGGQPGQGGDPNGKNGGRPGNSGKQGAGQAAENASDTLRRMREQRQQQLAGQGQRAGQGQSPGQAPGESPGQGQGQQGQSPGDPSQDGSPSSANSGANVAANGQNGANGQSGQQGQAGQAGQAGGANQNGGARGGANRAGNRGGTQVADAQNGARGGADRGGFNLDNAFNNNRGANAIGGGWGGWTGGPILGDNFGPWADRLRDVEDVLDQPALRETVAAARERARLARLDYKRDLKTPDWEVLRLEILKPLVEVRNRITEELARRESKDSLVPIDRDPVPTRYAESVRKYYEELGKDKPESQQ